jgi:hypothetical protein
MIILNSEKQCIYMYRGIEEEEEEDGGKEDTKEEGGREG